MSAEPDPTQMVEQLPETGDWKVTAGSVKAVAVDQSGAHPPRIMEQGKVSSRTRGRLQPVKPEDIAP